MRDKPDHYTKRAQKEGYPARSVYKLEEIQNKFNILRQGNRILDIGAAPGSWSLYALRKIGPSGFLMGVDLHDIKISPKKGRYKFLKGDVFLPENEAEILKEGPFETVISDAAPATTGNRTVDAGRSYSLVEQIIHNAPKYLKEGGNLVVKVFQGGDERELQDQMKTWFKQVKAFKPKAVRKESFEIYLIGTGFCPIMEE